MIETTGSATVGSFFEPFLRNPLTPGTFLPLSSATAAAAAAAVALLKGKKVPGVNGFRKNGSKKEPTVALPVVSITKANYTRLFTDGFLKKSQVCVGEYKKYCK